MKKNVPNLDYYDYTLEGKTWVDHEWLMNIITYLIYTKLGYFSLSVFFALIIVITLIFQALFVKKHFLKNDNTPQERLVKLKGDGLIMLLQALGVIAMSPHLGVRMQEISILFVLILLIILYQFSFRKNFFTLFLLIPLFYFWACLHAGFLIGLFLFSSFIFIKISEKIIKKINFFNFIQFQKTLTKKEICQLTSFFLISLSVTMITPYGLTLYSFLAGYTNTFYMTKIAEWLPLYYFPIQYAQFFYVTIVTTTLILCSFYFFRAKKNKTNLKINLWHLFLIILFLALSFKSKRHFPFLFIASFPFIVSIIQNHFLIPKNWFIFFTNSKIIKTYIILGLIIISLSYLTRTNFNNNPFQNPKYYPDLPFGATNYLKNHPQYQDYKILNDYSWGGYLIWTYPEKKLFIDGRLPQYQFAGHTILEEYFEFFNKEKTKDKLEEYKIKLVTIRLSQNFKLNWFEKYILKLKEDKINNVKNNLLEYLKDSNNWSLVYSDNISQIYVKN